MNTRIKPLVELEDELLFAEQAEADRLRELVGFTSADQALLDALARYTLSSRESVYLEWTSGPKVDGRTGSGDIDCWIETRLDQSVARAELIVVDGVDSTVLAESEVAA